MAEKKAKDTKKVDNKKPIEKSAKTDSKKVAKKECNKSKPVFICIICVAVVAVLTFVIMGLCGAFKAKIPAGEYELVDVLKDGTSQSFVLSIMKDFGVSPSITVNDNMTGKANFSGGNEKDDVVFNEKTIKSEKTNEEINYTYKDGKITIDVEDEQMVFEKKQ